MMRGGGRQGAVVCVPEKFTRTNRPQQPPLLTSPTREGAHLLDRITAAATYLVLAKRHSRWFDLRHLISQLLRSPSPHDQ